MRTGEKDGAGQIHGDGRVVDLRILKAQRPREALCCTPDTEARGKESCLIRKGCRTLRQLTVGNLETVILSNSHGRKGDSPKWKHAGGNNVLLETTGSSIEERHAKEDKGNWIMKRISVAEHDGERTSPYISCSLPGLVRCPTS